MRSGGQTWKHARSHMQAAIRGRVSIRQRKVRKDDERGFRTEFRRTLTLQRLGRGPERDRNS